MGAHRTTTTRGRAGAGASERPKAGRTGPKAPKTLTEAYSAGLGFQTRRKFNNQPTEVDGYRFDSRKEAERYATLRLLEQAGEISGLEIHPRFPLVVHGEDCGAYVGDFAYLDAAGGRHVEDVKSAATRKLPTYRLKRRLLWALYGLTVEER